MDFFPPSLLGNLKRALQSDELKREDDLNDVTEQLTRIFECDSLDLVELVTIVEERDRSPRTVGELLRLLEKGDTDDSATPTTRT